MRIIQSMCLVLLLPAVCAAANPGEKVTRAETRPSEINPTTHVYKKTSDRDIRLDVYQSRRKGVSPGIVWIHGGALIGGQRDAIAAPTMRYQLDAYLNAGFTLVSIDYRLAPETKIPEIVEDVRDAFAWVRDHAAELRIRPDRVAAMGQSAGGYLTLMSGTFSPRPQALVPFYGYGDIIGEWLLQPDPFYRKRPLVKRAEAYEGLQSSATAGKRMKFYLYTRQQGIWPDEIGGRDPDGNRAFFNQYCPVRNVNEDYPPTLLLHGTEDTDVPYQQSVQMADALHGAAVSHQLITISHQGSHGFDYNEKNPQAQAALQTVLAFLKKHLGD